MPVVKVEFTTKAWQEISKLARREMLEPRSFIADVIQKHIAAQQGVQADGACPNCGVKRGYHKTGCKLWAWEETPRR